MKNSSPLHNFLTIFFLMLLTVPAFRTVSAQSGESLTISGWLNVVWGDARDGTYTPPVYTLTDDDGQKITLLIEEATSLPAGILYLDRQHVTIQGAQNLSALADDGTAIIQVKAITLDDADISALTEANPLAVAGSKPFVSIMCKFNNISDEPNDLSYFQGMYGSSYPGLDHYWREVSYDTINIQGSNAHGWYTLPKPRSYYVYGGTFNFDRATTDCIGRANSDINFANFTGVNLMFNDDLDGYAWGGSRYLTLDGVTKSWPITWEPPWGYHDITVISHEMGHAFGLPHSSGSYGATYDNVWDVMSDTWTLCPWNNLSNYGCLGQHTIAYHKDILGWIPAVQKYTVILNSSAIVTLERLALPLTGDYKIVKIPINGSSTHFYTVEARQRAGYDDNLPGDAVIIHEVDTTRDRPAHVIDIDNNTYTNDSGAMWIPGETFTDAANSIAVTVEFATASGFQVSIANGIPRPGAFSKSMPTSSAINLAVDQTLSWEASNEVDFYEYCYDSTNDNACSNWINTGLVTSANITGLNIATTYYWQVRAVNAYGPTYANGGTYWKFNTGEAPALFSKSTPANNAINQSLSLTLQWNTSNGITPTNSYEYCYSTTHACSNWINAGLNTSASITGLSIATSYYWQARAINAFGITYANANTDWTFRTGEPPAGFTKSSPLNDAVNQSLSPTLKWNASNGITPPLYYEFCYDTSDNNICDTKWINTGLYRSADLHSLSPNTSYFWHARTANDFGSATSNSGVWYDFTTDTLDASAFNSVPANDGWVLESSEFSNTANKKNSNSILRVGDDAANKQYRTLLYFNTADIPDHAVLSSVIVKIKKASTAGTDPFTTHGNLTADMKNGFFGLSPLELTDFNATGAPISNAGSFKDITGGWYRLTLSPANFKYINLGGVTQFRLRFTKDDDNDKKADFISFFSSDDGTSPPLLIVEYTVP